MHKLNDREPRKNGWQLKRAKRRRLLQSGVNNSLKYFFLGTLLFLFACSSKKQVTQGTALSEIEQEKVTRNFIMATSAKIKENYPEAKRLFLKAIEEDDKVSAGYYNLADIFQMEEKYDSALIFAKRAIALEPENKWYREINADLYWRNRDRATSIKMYESLLDEFPGTRFYYKRLDNFYQREKDSEARINLALKEISYFGTNTKRLTNLSNLYLTVGENEKAKNLWVKELRDNPRNADAYVRLGRIYFFSKELVLLEDNYKKAYEELPYNTEVGKSYVEHILVYKPIEEIREFLLDSNHSLGVLKHLYDKARNKEQRLEIAAFLIDKNVATNEMLVNHALYLVGVNKYQKAVQMFQRVEGELDSEDKKAAYFRALLEVKSIVRAERLLDKIIEEYPFSNKIEGYKKKLKDAKTTK